MEYQELETGRYEVVDIMGRAILVDSCTGRVWVLRGIDNGKPVLVECSSTTPKGEKID